MRPPPTGRVLPRRANKPGHRGVTSGRSHRAHETNPGSAAGAAAAPQEANTHAPNA
jgi:hypothetical protein